MKTKAIKLDRTIVTYIPVFLLNYLQGVNTNIKS
jgi:hypothetical protein